MGSKYEEGLYKNGERENPFIMQERSDCDQISSRVRTIRCRVSQGGLGGRQERQRNK